MRSAILYLLSLVFTIMNFLLLIFILYSSLSLMGGFAAALGSTLLIAVLFAPLGHFLYGCAFVLGEVHISYILVMCSKPTNECRKFTEMLLTFSFIQLVNSVIAYRFNKFCHSSFSFRSSAFRLSLYILYHTCTSM